MSDLKLADPHDWQTLTAALAVDVRTVPTDRELAGGPADAGQSPAPAHRAPPPPRVFAIPEASRRKPDGSFDAPVVLADSQTWYLPKPRVRLTVSDGERGFRTVLKVDGRDDYQSLLDALDSADALDQGRLPALVAAELAVARALVTRNYDLTTAELTGLIQFSYDEEEDPEAAAIREAVMDVAVGNSGKVSGGTSGSR